MLLIGSHALNYRLGKIREPVDIDYIGTFEELVEYQKKHKESIESIVYESDKKVIIKRKDCIVEFEVAYEGESGFDALSFGGEKILFDGKWLEMGGAGMVHPNVLKSAGIDSDIWKGFAFGFGIDRLVMRQNNIPDVRMLFDGDLRFINQF
jgi:hypothetical protein